MYSNIYYIASGKFQSEYSVRNTVRHKPSKKAAICYFYGCIPSVLVATHMQHVLAP